MFLQSAREKGYSMDSKLVDAAITQGVSDELSKAGFMKDLVELESTHTFRDNKMLHAHLLHAALNEAIARETKDYETNHLPLFSVRVFEPGEHIATIHRNHESIGPWAIGVTLSGSAPFNVYADSQLQEGEVLPLTGGALDPEPLETMNAGAGSAWTLYTANELVPHSSGIVESSHPRSLLIMYGSEYQNYTP